MGEGVFRGRMALVLRKEEETRLHWWGEHLPEPLRLMKSSLRNQDILASSQPGGSPWNSLDVTAGEVPV